MKTNIKMILLIFFCTIYVQTALCQKAGKPVYYYNPKYSPDGSAIVFESTRDGKSSIYTIAPDGTRLKKITDTIFDYGQPAWSPNGRNLVYYGSSHPMQLFTYSLKSGKQKQLPTPGQDAYEPSWSLQNKIAFDSRSAGQTPNDIAIMNADGTGYTKLATDEKYDCSSPQWSSDGKKILFQRSNAIRKPWKDITPEEMKQKKKSVEIMMMNADGTDKRTLLSGLQEEVAPFLSHDGNIYYIEKQDTAPVLYITTMDEPMPILTLSGIIYSVNVSPDGKYVTYAAERGKKHAIYVQDIKKKTETKLIGD